MFLALLLPYSLVHSSFSYRQIERLKSRLFVLLYVRQKLTQVNFFNKLLYGKIMFKLSCALIKRCFCYHIELEEMTSTRTGCFCSVVDFTNSSLRSCDQEVVWLRRLGRHFSFTCTVLQLNFVISHSCGVLIFGNRKRRI